MDGNQPETCAECGFDSSEWRVRDAGTLFDELGYWWGLALAGTDQEDLNRRPSPGVWSALEYGLHSSLVTAVNRAGIELILAEDGCTLPDPPQLDPAEDGSDGLVLAAAPVLRDLQREGQLLAELTRRTDAPWSNAGILGDLRLPAEFLLLHAVHDATHHFLDVSRGLAAIGAGTPRDRGTIIQINTSKGGVPKHPVVSGEVAIEWTGVDGDVQANRKHHGRPFQAVCLWSAEVIADLAAAGHPIAPGSAGENLTVSGLDWTALRPGTRLRAGTALLEVSYPAVPCRHQSKWFADGDFSRISHDEHPESARWYAWVREPGKVRAGDDLVVG